MPDSGDVVEIEFGAPEGREAGMRRPEVVVAAQRILDAAPSFVQVVPLTSTIRSFHSEVVIEPDPATGLEVASAAQCQHLRAVSPSRIVVIRGNVGALAQASKPSPHAHPPWLAVAAGSSTTCCLVIGGGQERCRRATSRTRIRRIPHLLATLADHVVPASPRAHHLCVVGGPGNRCLTRHETRRECDDGSVSHRTSHVVRATSGPDTVEVVRGHGFVELLGTPGVVEHVELRSSFGFMAYHGGALEAMTDVIAEAAAEAAGASYYGIHQPPGVRMHVPSTQVRPEQSEALASFIGHVDVVVTVHGFGRRGFFTSLLLGGRNRTLADHVGGHLRGRLPAYDVVTDLDRIPTGLRGMHEDNPVNLPRRQGVQVELPPRVRGSSPLWWDWEHGLTPHTEALVAALAEAATTWAD